MRCEEVERIGSEQWTTVYSFQRGSDGHGGYFCALVPEDRISEVMGHDSWDLLIGDGQPGFSQSYGGQKPATTYHRFGGRDSVEPLVFKRSFDGLKPDYIELSEEFRHLMRLYHDRHNDRYLRFDENGNEDVVAEVSREIVRIKTRPLRQFLAARRLHLAIYFDWVAFASSYPAGSQEALEAEVARPDLRYSLRFGDHTLHDSAFSRLLGKRLIPPLALEECGIWPYEEKAKPGADFIIGLDQNGKPIEHSCDPEGLSNLFGKNPGAPHFLTPVVFRREVLKKYFDHPEKYEVSDGYLRCAGLWGLRMDNDSDDRVTVFLGDLGESLGHEEQLHWRSHNIPPLGDGKDISPTNQRRAFEGEFADPSSPELVFKYKLTEFQERWDRQFGWQLVRPLRDEDGHVLKKLRVPLTSSMAEFEDQLLGLTKVLVDSLNDKELAKALGGALPDEKSIAKFERYLTLKGYPGTRRDIELLRLLQDARSSMSAHRKGDGFKRVVAKLELKTETTTKVFSKLLVGAVEMLDGLTAFFLAPPSTSGGERTRSRVH